MITEFSAALVESRRMAFQPTAARRSRRFSRFISTLVLAPLFASAGLTDRIDLTANGLDPDDLSSRGDVSADGRIVVFQSSATNLVTGDNNNRSDIFAFDRISRTLRRVSVATGGSQANLGSNAPVVSANGRFVAFQSSANNLVGGDSNTAVDIFVHDRRTGETTRVSVASDGSAGNSQNTAPSISADGRYVAFESLADNLVSGDTNGMSDVFVHDRQGGQTTRVSRTSSAVEGNAASLRGRISANGRYVVFESEATNLTAGDSNSSVDVFLHDRQIGSTTLVSVAMDGGAASSHSQAASVSNSGSRVAFQSLANNLVADDTNGNMDVFVRDIPSGVTTLVSRATGGTQSNEYSYFPDISADGQMIGFFSVASNLVEDDTNSASDAFVHDLRTQVTERVSQTATGNEANGGSQAATLSDNGRFVAFESTASNLVGDDVNGIQDIFIYDRWPHDELTPTGVSVGDRAGSSVAIDGPHAAVGIPHDDHSGFENVGSVAIFRRHPISGIWKHIVTHTSDIDSSMDQDRFGNAVAMDADTLVVGAENDDDIAFRAGLVNVYSRNAGGNNYWALLNTLKGSDTDEGDYFGHSVAVDGDRLVVGAHLADAQGEDAGAIYVFERHVGGQNKWGQTQKITASDGAAGDRFGSVVAISGDQILVGAPQKQTAAGASAGQAYLLRHNGFSWVEQRIILPASGQNAGDQFGYSVDLDDAIAVVGARFSDSAAGNQTGSVHVFARDEGGPDEWGERGVIEASDAAAGDRFGTSVAIKVNRIVVGAPFNDDRGEDAGKVYVYDTSLNAMKPLTNEFVSVRDEFGSAVATDGVQCLVGSWLDNRPGNNSGGAYRFDVP